ncbi:MAG: methyltransferase domain-containing protein [bacterium]
MVAPGPGHVSYGDVHALPYEGGAFGAAVASHVLEHVAHPELALRELRRVADVVFVICPPWWTPHAWLHPGHRWLQRGSGEPFEALWQAPPASPLLLAAARLVE